MPKNKTQSCQTNAPLNPIPPTNRPWQTISVDLIGPLWDSKGFDAILVIVDYYTKMKVLYPTTTHVTAMGITPILTIWNPFQSNFRLRTTICF
jgi:hypothetical protein